MIVLAEAGIDVLSFHKISKTNALHVVIERKYYEIAQMLIESNYPMNIPMKGGLTALMIAA